MQSFDIFFVVSLSMLLNKSQIAGDLRRHEPWS